MQISNKIKSSQQKQGNHEHESGSKGYLHYIHTSKNYQNNPITV